MKITDIDPTKEYECCCSCKHNIRKTRDNDHVYCECELDGHYIGYVANFESVCKKWEDAYADSD